MKDVSCIFLFDMLMAVRLRFAQWTAKSAVGDRGLVVTVLAQAAKLNSAQSRLALSV